MKRKLKHCSSLPKRMVLGASLALIATGSLWATRASSTSLHTDIVESITQQKTIKVLDVQGESIIGANVIIKGTSNGVITDIDGNFTLDNVQVGSVIQISYIGYLTKEVKITGNTTELKIALTEDAQSLDEVVVMVLKRR